MVTICECLWSSLLLVERLVKNYDNTRISTTVMTFQEHRAHMVGPLTVCLGLGLAGLVWLIVTLAAVLKPKIRLSHRRD